MIALIPEGFFVHNVHLTLTNQNSIQEEIKSRLKSRNACYHSVLSLLSSRLLSKNVKIKVYRPIILHVVLYGVKLGHSHLGEERGLRLFENRVSRRIFGPKRAEVTGEWRQLHNEQLNDLYSSPIILRVIKSRRMRWAGHVVHMGERRGIYRVLVGKPEGKRPLGRPSHRHIYIYIYIVSCHSSREHRALTKFRHLT